MLIDTHCHLNFGAFADTWKEVVERAVAAGVEKMIVVGTDLETSKRAVTMAQEHPAIYAAVGIHPHHARSFHVDAEIAAIRQLLEKPKVVAIGEIGLDRHAYTSTRYPATNIEDYWEIQQNLFVRQIDLAMETGMPVIMHSREVGEEVLTMAAGVQGVFHCFEGSKKYLKRILEAGFYVSFTGNITFIPDRAEVSLGVPLDRLLVETDSPYMTPAPFRGEVNEPAHVQLIAEKHATMRAIQLDEVAAATTANAQRLFHV